MVPSLNCSGDSGSGSSRGGRANHGVLHWARLKVHRPASHAFDVLGDPVRRRILELLIRGELSAGNITDVIQKEFGITQAGVSQHLKSLRKSGFVQVRVEGPK